MKRIAITPEIDYWAQQFQRDMLYKTPNVEKSIACKQLKELISEIKMGWLVPQDVTDKDGKIRCNRRKPADLEAYINKIIDEYETLLIIQPSKFVGKIREFEKLISTDEVCVIELLQVRNAKGATNPSKKFLFHDRLVKAMRYGYVQSHVFPKYIRLLGIKTCVYCNSQYAVTTRSNESLYQLDHCLPKSRYPYFSTSFFNLQPCCGPCNLRKSDNDMLYGNRFATIWRENNEPDIDYFSFLLTDDSLTNYLLSHRKDDLEIEFTVEDHASTDLDSLFKDYQKYFKIDSLYAEHKDVAEEIIWKKYVYTNSYLRSLRSAFNVWMNSKNPDFSRLIMGTYMNKDEVYKRPLSKMIQDIAKQLHLDFEQKE